MKLLSLFLRPSTKDFIDESRRAQGYSLYDLLHGYLYLRWPYLYIGVATGEHPRSQFFSTLFLTIQRLFRRHSDNQPASIGQNGRDSWADTYHGKVVPLKEATRLVTINKNIDVRNLERVLPYTRARDIILKNPDHIVVLQCPCRTARANPCLPLDVCLIVGEPFASFSLEHHPKRARRITQAEAVEILRAEDERGHVHHAFFKDAMLGRFYAICNCCSCCCGAMEAHRNGTPMLASSGFVCEVDEALCAACGDCSKYCQFGALNLVFGENTVEREKCMGCGVCVSKCEQGALSLTRAPEKGVPLEIEALMSQSVASVEGTTKDPSRGAGVFNNS